MTPRFEIVDEEYIKESKNQTENEDKKNSTEWWKSVFKKWANERNLRANFEEYENDVLNQRLSEIKVICPLYFQKVVAMDPRKIKV